MRQGEHGGPIVPPRCDCLRHAPRGRPQMICLSITPKYDRKAHSGQFLQKCLSPSGRTLRPGRLVARAPRTGIAEAHGEDREQTPIVERLLRNSKPLPKTDTTRVLEGHPRRMDPAARSLTGDQDHRVGVHLYDRSRTQGKVRRTDLTCPDLSQELLEFFQAPQTIQRTKPLRFIPARPSESERSESARCHRHTGAQTGRL